MAVTELAWPASATPPPAGSAGTASCVPRAVWLLAAGHGNRLHVITASAASIVEVDPATLVVAVSPDSRILSLIRACGAFTASVLAAHHGDLAARFSHPGRALGLSQLAGLGWSPAPSTGSPLLDGMHVWFDCEVSRTLDAGGSVLIVGAARAVSGPPQNSAEALLRLGGRYVPVRNRTGHVSKVEGGERL